MVTRADQHRLAASICGLMPQFDLYCTTGADALDIQLTQANGSPDVRLIQFGALIAILGLTPQERRPKDTHADAFGVYAGIRCHAYAPGLYAEAKNSPPPLRAL